MPDTGSDWFFSRRRIKNVLLGAIGGRISRWIVAEWAGSKETPVLGAGLRRSAPILRRRISALRGVPRRSRSPARDTDPGTTMFFPLVPEFLSTRFLRYLRGGWWGGFTAWGQLTLFFRLWSGKKFSTRV